MKRLLAFAAVVAIVAVPAVAQAEPVVVKPLMIYTANNDGWPDYSFSAGQTINLVANYAMKGLGTCRLRMQVLNGKGIVIYRTKPELLISDMPIFESAGVSEPFTAPAAGGFYTLRFIYTDVASGKSWIQQTKVYVSPAVKE